MSNLTQRFITGFIGVAIVLSAILYSQLSSLLLITFISSMSLFEFYKLTKNDNIQPHIALGIATGVILFLPLMFGSFMPNINLLPLIFILPYLVFIRELYTKSEKPFTNIAYTILGNIYISAPMFMFFLISFHGSGEEYKPMNLLGYFFILWANDIGGYTAGRIWGKHKMFERISPKKTWEGFVGSGICAIGIAFAVAQYCTAFTLTQWLVIASIIFITGVLGDLVESMFKRSLVIKDSGSLLPGHGGFLDRFDALFISAPFVFFYLSL
ncbi:MAG: phosphatidate cytidylyltransferase [Bacteroidia bacterium]|nr:phosphatidate cytidylyltransferase [Bacteroidia bacterium]MBP9922784.1 phosphatidate cytidylyltransferase [Bacteroidia bacterium]